MKQDTDRSPMSREPGSRESDLFAPAAEEFQRRSAPGRSAEREEEGETDLEALGQLPGEGADEGHDELEEGELDEEDEEFDEDDDENEEELDEGEAEG